MGAEKLVLCACSCEQNYFQTKSFKILWMCEICTFAHLQGLKNECDVPAVANKSPLSLNSVRKAVLCTGTVAKK